MKRISDLYKDIDNIMSENEYHDDDTGEDVCYNDLRGGRFNVYSVLQRTLYSA